MAKYDVTLTFDNGPTPGVTSRVLEVLARHGVRATFFVLGSRLSDPEGWRVCEKAHGEGHWIGNHSWSHPAPFGACRDRRQVESQILRTERLLSPLARPERLFRPPGDGGRLDNRLLSEAAIRLMREQAITCVLWNVVPRDWEQPDRWVDRAIDMCVRRPWSLVVLHDTGTGAMDRLSGYLDRVRETGGGFRQDFPPECVPIRKGRIVGPVDKYTSEQDREAALQ